MSKTRRQALVEGIKLLRPTLAEEAEISARFLLAGVLGIDQSHLILQDELPLTSRQWLVYKQGLGRRIKGEPVAYITGRRDFFGLSIAVNQNVLIPRPETEQLVQMVIDYCQTVPKAPSPTIVDIGTGSGAIALALASHLPTAKIIAVDNSSSALTLARQNAIRLGLNKQIKFENTNLLRRQNGRLITGQVMVANLPYVPTSRLSTLDNAILNFEPMNALDGGIDGLASYRALFGQLKELTTKPQIILMEIDEQHQPSFRLMAQEFWPNWPVTIRPDLAGHCRYALIAFADFSNLKFSTA